LNTLSSLIYGEKEGFNHERIRNLEAAEMSLIVPILLFAGITIALGAKWQIKSKIVWIWISFIALLYGATVILLGLYVPNMSAYHIGLAGFLQSIIITVIALLASFFRDPERIPPQTNGNILSPADGEVVYVKKIEKNEFPFSIKGKNFIPLSELTKNDFISSGGYQIGIGMNFLNVHVNRAPISGKISLLNRVPGRFHSLKQIKSLLENERVCTIICGEKVDICVVQIASRLVRRIITYIERDSLVKSGQRIGMICFGSQVDLLIPYNQDIKIMVNEKDEVKAGVTIIAKY
jgi:phosphatidylserine decarboxylase